MGADGCYVWGEFERLLMKCQVARALGRDDVDSVHHHLRAVANRLTDLRTCAMKLDWMVTRRDEGDLDPFVWMFFASSDVSSFLTNVRSLFDHLGRAIRAAAPQPRGVPQYSFNDLRKWSLRNDLDQVSQLGARQHELVVQCDWFDDLKRLRDDLVHEDAQTIVFPNEPGVAVQVYGGARLLIREPALMSSQNVAMFERLAAAAMARLFVLLDETAQAMSSTLALAEPSGRGMSVHSGLSVLSRWTDDYLSALAAT
jgi:hypothetical protein